MGIEWLINEGIISKFIPQSRQAEHKNLGRERAASIPGLRRRSGFWIGSKIRVFRLFKTFKSMAANYNSRINPENGRSAAWNFRGTARDTG